MTHSRLIVLVALMALGVAPDIMAQGSEPEPGATIPAYLVVITSRLNVREGASLDFAVSGVALRGQILCPIRYNGAWAEVRSAATARPELRGWVSRGFVAERRASPAQLEEAGCPTRS